MRVSGRTGVNPARDLLEGLNTEQRLAVAHVRGPLRIVAGAGTGKTRTLTHRFSYLVEQGIPPDKILALTFSRRAAGEFKIKTLNLLDASYARLWISTFHGFCLRVMREERDVFGNPKVMGEAEQRRVIARAVRYDPHAEARTYYVGQTGEQRLVADALTLISRTKDEAISPAGFVEYADRRGVERLRELANTYLVYVGLCERENRLDFGDLGALLVDAFERDPALLQRWRVRFEHVMVDEFQDTNEVQWRLLTLLAPHPHANLTVVGDACQAIYAFRGASSHFFNRFEDEYPGATTVKLSTNYRSRQHILDAAYALIGCNRGHESHRLQCESGEAGGSVRIAGFADEDAEADYVARRILKLTVHEGLRPEQCAVLCRSVKQSARPLARAFAAYGVPFSMRGYDPEMEDAVQDLCAVLRCVAGSAVWTDAARVLLRRRVAFSQMIKGLQEEPLAERVGELLGPNQDVLRAVPPLDPLLYGRVSDWLDGSETWQLLPMVRDELPAHLIGAREALDLLEAACSWMRDLTLERQVYAAMALVGRLDASRAADGTSVAGASACHHALRIAHALQRSDLGIPELLAELATLGADDAEGPKIGSRTGVPILTLHASKGLEWPAVFVVGVAAGRMPAPLRLDRAFDLEDLAQHVHAGGRKMIAQAAALYEAEPESRRAVRFLEEERRLAYVGCTRAERHLTVTYAASYDRQEALASPFIADLQHASKDTWQLDPESDSGVLLPLDVARSVRQGALAALGVSPRPAAPRIDARMPSPETIGPEMSWPLRPTSSDHQSGGDGGDVVGTVLAAEWTAAQVAGGVPIRFRALPQPFTEQSTLRLSFSGLNNYQNCPRKYFYSHVLHVPDPVRGASATLGSKLHSAIMRLNAIWMTRGTPPDDAEVQDAWRGVWPIDGKTIDASLADPNVRVPWQPGFSFARQTVQGWRRGAGYLRRYYFGERQMCNGGAVRVPVAIEEAFAFAYRGHTIDGRIDCVLRTPEYDVVVDYKSGESSDLRAKKSLQLAIYERAWRERGESQTGRPLQVAYYLLGQKGDKPGDLKPWSSKQVEAEVQDETDREALWAGVDASLDGITGNRFQAAPAGGSKTCAECAYRFWCPESLA